MIVFPAPWTLAAKDLTGLTLEKWTERLSASQTLANFDRAGYTVPKDRLLFLTQLSWAATPSGGQTFESFEVGETEDGATTGEIYGTRGTNDYGVAPVANAQAFREAVLSYVVRPGGRLRYVAFFSAGVSTNVIQCTVQGWLVARGSIAIASSVVT